MNTEQTMSALQKYTNACFETNSTCFFLKAFSFTFQLGAGKQVTWCKTVLHSSITIRLLDYTLLCHFEGERLCVHQVLEEGMKTFKVCRGGKCHVHCHDHPHSPLTGFTRIEDRGTWHPSLSSGGYNPTLIDMCV